MNELSITVREMAGIDLIRPVTGGVPIAKGSAPEGTAFYLRDERGEEVPLQTSILARWKDGSARWVLLDFQSRPPANGLRSYILSWGKGIQPKEIDMPVRQIAGEKPSLRSGDLAVSPSDDAILNISDRIDLFLSLTDSEGRRCEAVVESVEVAVSYTHLTLPTKA